MKLTKILFAAFAASASVSSPAYEVSVSGFIGHSQVSSDWRDEFNVDDSVNVFGVFSDHRIDDWPLAIAIDGFFWGDLDSERAANSDQQPEYEATGAQLHLGVRKYWPVTHNFHVYTAGGPAFIRGSVSEDFDVGGSKDDSDSVTGAWISVGTRWDASNHLHLGFDIRVSNGEIELFGDDIAAGNTTAGLFIGYRW